MKFWQINRDKNVRVTLSELANCYDLSFSSHMILSDKIIALDSAKKKLMISDFRGTAESVCIVDLNEVKAVSLQQTYENIEAGELSKKEIDEFITSIQLQFEYHNNPKKSSLLFYRRTLHVIRDLAKFRRNAKSWHMILSRLIKPVRKI
ncbi:MAG: hypothetical protein JST09_10875 [Bacteroidetes bacterium]|nr:hypothetical protein [Bacteroidota bacterium]MBS1608784.1 hypothetical protein [Bacteroidota bacterium]